MRLNLKRAFLGVSEFVLFTIAVQLVTPGSSWAAGTHLDQLFGAFQSQMAQMNQQMEQFRQLQQAQNNPNQPATQNPSQQATNPQMMQQPGFMQGGRLQMMQQPAMPSAAGQTQQPQMDQQARENLAMLANQMSAFLDKVSNDPAFRQQLADSIAKDSQLWDVIGKATQAQNAAESQFVQKMKNDEQFRQQVINEFMNNPQFRNVVISRAKDALNQIRMQIQNQ